MKAELTTEIIGMVMRNGRKYTSAPLPDEIPFGKIGHCFDESIMAAVRSNGKYRYVEGIASSPEDPNKLLLHAWITDGEHAYDVTWRVEGSNGKQYRMPLPSFYYGIEIPIDRVIAYMRITENQGIIANQHISPHDFKQLFGDLLDVRKAKSKTKGRLQ